MEYQTIVVHVDESKHCKARVSLAADLTNRFDSHLVGVYLSSPVAQPHALQDPWLARELAERAEEAKHRADAAKTIFHAAANAVEPSRLEFRTLDIDPLSGMTINARYADLIVVGQADPDEQTATPQRFPEEVVLSTGRPVLVVPYFTDSFADVGRNVLIAWNTSREATRAVTDALPFLARAQKVTIISVNPKVSEKEHGELPGADLALYLSRHVVKAEIMQSYGDEIGVGNELLARAADNGIDLLVMGAYGHARLRELVLGGVTQTMIRHMTVPVLMSH